MYIVKLTDNFWCRTTPSITLSGKEIIDCYNIHCGGKLCYSCKFRPDIEKLKHKYDGGLFLEDGLKQGIVKEVIE